MANWQFWLLIGVLMGIESNTADIPWFKFTGALLAAISWTYGAYLLWSA